MRYTGPKNRIARRENMDLSMKTAGSQSYARLLKKLNILPGQHGTRRKKKTSEHSKQLREKQKLRYMFGVTETQMKKYFTVASRKKGNTALFLAEILERRLDNIVYRLGMAPTRAASRQLVSHGHIVVESKHVDIPSFQVKTGMKISYSSKNSAKIPYVEQYKSQTDVIIPEWLITSTEGGSLQLDPSSSLLENQINLRLVVEFYSR
jgi:small subunit ribosomal protein S4